MNVLQHEAAAVLASHFERGNSLSRLRRQVITTEPRSWQQRLDTFGLGQPPVANTELFFDMLSAPGEMIQQLLDPDPLEREPAAKWVGHHDRITRQFAALSESKERKRMIARRRYWNENIGIYRQALTEVSGVYESPLCSGPAPLPRSFKPARCVAEVPTATQIR